MGALIKRFAHSLLIWILVLEIGGVARLPIVLASAPDIPASPQKSSSPPPALHPLTVQVLQAASDPWLDALNNPNFPLPEASFRFTLDDPALDQDPFFMRSQRWIRPGAAPSSVLRVALDADDARFAQLEIDQPLKLIGRTDDFIFLAAKDQAFFESKVAWDAGSQSKGVFLLHRRTWEAAYAQEAPVPLYFLPLADGEWDASHARATELHSHDAVQFSDGVNPPIPVPLSDLELLVKAESLHLMFARSLNFIDTLDRTRKPTPLDLSRVLPAIGSTAGFGVLFTGLNLENPKRSIDLSKIFPDDIRQDGLEARLRELWEKLELIPIARADWITPRMKDRILRVGMILGITTILSVVLRATVYRSHFARLEEEEKAAGKRSSWIGRNTRYILTVKAHALLLLSQFHSATFGNLTEYLADRWFPKKAAGEKTRLRKFLKWTTLRNREYQHQVPVDYKTFLLGTGVLGGIDTLLVAYQVQSVTPEAIRWIGENIPGMQERAQQALMEGNSDIESIQRNTILSCGIGYLTSGAADYSINVQAQLLQVIEQKVNEAMEKEGLNPADPRNKTIREKRIRAILSKEMVAKGLPDPDEFLFDYNTTYAQGLKLLGFKGEEGKTLVGSQRPGLTLSALKESIRRVKARLKIDRFNVEAQAALKILEETRRNLSFLRAWLGKPFGALFTGGDFRTEFSRATAAVLAAKKQLIALTYEGDRTLDPNAIPMQWAASIGQDGARIASQAYRESFYDLLTGEKPDFRHLRAEEYPEIDKMAEENAIEELKERLGLPATQPLTETLRQAHRYELALIKETERLELARLREDVNQADGLETKKPSFFERWQIRRITAKADKAFLKSFGRPYHADYATPEEHDFWQKAFVRSYGKTVGVRLTHLSTPRGLEITRRQLSDPEIMENLKWVEWDKGPKERAKLEALYHAINEVEEHIKHVADNTEADALSPEQPGITQGLRNYLLRRNLKSKIATRALRFADALFSNASYKLGLRNWIYRSVPMSFDITQAITITLSYLPTTLISGYLFYTYFWQLDNPFSVHAFNGLLTWFVAGPARTVNRIFQYQGIKPMGNFWTATALAVIFSWATFLGFIPQQLFAHDWINTWNAVRDACSNALK